MLILVFADGELKDDEVTNIVDNVRDMSVNEFDCVIMCYQRLARKMLSILILSNV
jgi:hypothetical protein